MGESRRETQIQVILRRVEKSQKIFLSECACVFGCWCVDMCVCVCECVFYLLVLQRAKRTIPLDINLLDGAQAKNKIS